MNALLYSIAMASSSFLRVLCDAFYCGVRGTCENNAAGFSSSVPVTETRTVTVHLHNVVPAFFLASARKDLSALAVPQDIMSSTGSPTDTSQGYVQGLNFVV